MEGEQWQPLPGKVQATDEHYVFAVFPLVWLQYLMWGCFCCSLCGHNSKELQVFTHQPEKYFCFSLEEVNEFLICMVRFWSYSAWTQLADFRNLGVRKNACAISCTFFYNQPQAISEYRILAQSYLSFEQLLLVFTSTIRWVLSKAFISWLWNFMCLQLRENEVPFNSCLSHSWVSLGW